MFTITIQVALKGIILKQRIGAKELAARGFVSDARIITKREGRIYHRFEYFEFMCFKCIISKFPLGS